MIPIQARRRPLEHVLEHEALHRGPTAPVADLLRDGLALDVIYLAVLEVSLVRHAAFRDAVDVEDVGDCSASRHGHRPVGVLQVDDVLERVQELHAVLARLLVA